MNDWVRATSQYYENYSYDPHYKAKSKTSLTSLTSLPPKPIQPNRSQMKKTQSMLSGKRNLNPTIKSISKLIGQDDSYPKKKQTPSQGHNLYTYQTQAQSQRIVYRSSGGDDDSYESDDPQTQNSHKYYLSVPNEPTYVTMAPDHDEVYENENTEEYYFDSNDKPNPSRDKDSVVYYISNPDEYGKSIFLTV